MFFRRDRRRQWLTERRHGVMRKPNLDRLVSYKGGLADSPQAVTHTSLSANTNSRSRKVISGLDPPVEAVPKAMRESTSSRSRRACILARLTRLRKLLRFSSSQGLICFRSKVPVNNRDCSFTVRTASKCRR